MNEPSIYNVNAHYLLEQIQNSLDQEQEEVNS